MCVADCRDCDSCDDPNEWMRRHKAAVGQGRPRAGDALALRKRITFSGLSVVTSAGQPTLSATPMIEADCDPIETSRLLKPFLA